MSRHSAINRFGRSTPREALIQHHMKHLWVKK